MIVVDGRTDIEKLRELLQAPEETHLEFKTTLDLNDPRDSLNFVKDAVTMANRPPGGYILIGVNDDGALALPVGAIPDKSAFDGARLGDRIRRYVEGEVHVVSQHHEIDNHEVILIYLPPHRDGLPVPMSKLGQYDVSGDKPVVVFRPGDVLVREGAKNTPLRHAHWHDLLRERDNLIRQQARADVDALLADLASKISNSTQGAPPALPLAVDLTEATFTQALIPTLDDDLTVRQFLGQALAEVSGPHQANALDKITIVAATAMCFERPTIEAQAIDTLYDAYVSLGIDDARFQLDIITRVYALGSLAVRLRKWKTVHQLVLKPSDPTGGSTSVYSSWIRHGQVAATRAGLFPKGKGGMMISLARGLLDDHPSWRQDLTAAAIPESEHLDLNDPLFNSLCQFDILYCLIVATEGQHRRGGYPASSAMHQERVNRVFEQVATNAQVRMDLFPDSTDGEIAAALLEVFVLARNESFSFGAHWSDLPNRASDFVNANT